jgi:hypothetical protein
VLITHIYIHFNPLFSYSSVWIKGFFIGEGGDVKALLISAVYKFKDTFSLKGVIYGK